MSFDLNKIISGIEDNKPRILLYSMPKVGKTTFASKFPNHILINVDGSSERVNCVRTPRIKSVKEYTDIIETLYTTKHNYTTVVIDTVDWLEKLICDDIAEMHGQETVENIRYGQGYPQVVKRWHEYLEVLDDLRLKRNMTILMLAHADVKHHVSPMGDDYDYYAPRLYSKSEKTETSLAIMLEFSDIIAFAHNKILTKKVGDGFNERLKPLENPETMLYTSSKNPSYIAGNRFGLKEDMPFSYNAFASDFLAKTKKKVDAKKKDGAK